VSGRREPGRGRQATGTAGAKPGAGGLPLFGGPLDRGAPAAPGTPPDSSARILVGTSGYSFADWVGTFYPPGMRSADFLRFYAEHFPAVEVNATYYRIPDRDVFERMERKTPAGFRFVVKLHQSMTHEGSADPALCRQFLEAIAPLREAGKFDGLLAQFPWAFRRTPEHEAHLCALRERFGDDPLFVEFRHASWAVPDLAAFLEQRRLGYCAVDEPALDQLMPPIALRTATDAYVRFHGRNAQNWWGRGGGDRYDWDYKADELREWLGRIQALADQARRTYLFFNNCHAGQAARSAKLMQELLRQQKLGA
jgi:uncharacterized protein YecE (DUF72 family)